MSRAHDKAILVDVADELNSLTETIGSDVFRLRCVSIDGATIKLRWVGRNRNVEVPAITRPWDSPTAATICRGHALAHLR